MVIGEDTVCVKEMIREEEKVYVEKMNCLEQRAQAEHWVTVCCPRIPNARLPPASPDPFAPLRSLYSDPACFPHSVSSDCG
ncbi:hypothetical protein DPEC_G00350490 [Dallia pectoralis]|uniref:Uncharacterized protein n=1 Tax=Dallia pectoralis TaxID=75939 RepID=A0ACC2F1N4_DALPE|nr:hypothetical protein DPEC_G00350490 [Dallia pectoralis]